MAKNYIKNAGTEIVPLMIIKIGRKEHLEEIANGKLRFTDIEQYRTAENKGKPWHDGNEDTFAVFQSDQIKFKIVLNKTGEQTILDSSTGLVNQVFLKQNRTNLRVFCLHTISYEKDTTLRGEDLLANIRVPANLRKFGDSILLFKDFNEFQKRLNNALDGKPIHGQGKQVQYVDFQNSHGYIEDNQLGFTKDISFSSEREHRILLKTPTDTPKIFNLEIGSLNDIVEILSFDDFNLSLEISMEDEV